MSNKEIAKEAFAEVEKAQKEKQVATVKRIVEKTLEKLDCVKSKIKELREEEKILELDIDDLKAGKIDQIVERQEKSDKAKNTSVVIIIKEKVEHHYSPWYWPYQVTWQTVPLSTGDKFYCNTSGNGDISTLTVSNSGWSSNICSNTINCSVAKDATIGTYTIGGHSVYLR